MDKGKTQKDEPNTCKLTAIHLRDDIDRLYAITKEEYFKRQNEGNCMWDDLDMAMQGKSKERN